MIDLIIDSLTSLGIPDATAEYFSHGLAVLLILIFSYLTYIITKKIVLRILAHYIYHNRFLWDDYLFNRKVFNRLSLITPAIIVYWSASIFPVYISTIQKLSMAYIIIVGLLVIDAFLDAIEDIYKTFEVSKHKPIRGIIQVIKIFLYIIGGIWFISLLIERSPLLLLSGIGALTAVILLVFKDSLLGLVGGIQLAANDMVRIGDWIEMPKYGADGDVIDISLNTVKIKNFDNTITTIPTYALISDSFKNWRGMQESGGRRIKRSIHIDSTSITFCTEEMLERFKKIQYITEYLEQKLQECQIHNQEHDVDCSQLVNGRRLTNIGTFRAYLHAYLKNHPKIHKEMTHMVRQLPAGESGLPLEIYAFTTDTAWVNYESIQADIFDHIFAVIPLFDLRIHQNPTGYDMRHMLSVKENT